MNSAIFDRVKNKEALIVLVNKDGEIVFEKAISPASTLYIAYFKGELNNLGDLTAYCNQAGMAVAVISNALNIKEVYAYQASEYGIEAFEKKGVALKYEEKIPLVKSSKDETKVCPVEQYLVDHRDDEKAMWDFLKERYDTDTPHTSCSLAAHRK